MAYSPARAFASVTPPSREPMRHAEMDENLYVSRKTDRQIQVTAVGEVSLPPDRCRVTIRVTSVKDNVEDAKNSVQRRLDYILQTFRNHKVKDTDIQVHKSMRRSETMYDMNAEVIAVFLDVNKCEAACNLLVEKLDENVVVGLPDFYHAGTTLENLRQQASLLAVHNAKQKAQEMARFVHQAVGRPISIQEEECKEWEGLVEGGADMETRPTIQQRISQATVTVSCKVSVCFELKQKVKSSSAK